MKSQNCDTTIKGVTYVYQEYQKERKEKTEEIFEAIVTVNPPKLMSEPTTDAGSSGNTKQE